MNSTPPANHADSVRLTTDCRQMTPEQKREHRLEQKRRSYARTKDDPVKKAKRRAAEQARYRRLHGPSKRIDLSGMTPEQRREHKLAVNRASRKRRLADPTVRAKVRQQAKQRVDYKRQWRQDHAAKMNANRQADRQANPEKYRARESAYKKRKRALKRAAKAAANA